VRRLCPRPGSDAGFGLVELLVSMAMGSILLLALGTTFAGTLRTSTATRAKVSNTAELRLAMDTMARRLRVAVRPGTGAPAFLLAESGRVRFFASLESSASPSPSASVSAEPRPTVVEYSLGTGSAGCLQESLSTPTGSAAVGWSYDASATPRTRCLARGAVTAVFAYYADGATVTALGSSGAALSLDADRDAVRSVSVRGSVGSVGASSATATLASTRVTLSNLLTTS